MLVWSVWAVVKAVNWTLIWTKRKKKQEPNGLKRWISVGFKANQPQKVIMAENVSFNVKRSQSADDWICSGSNLVTNPSHINEQLYLYSAYQLIKSIEKSDVDPTVRNIESSHFSLNLFLLVFIH